MFGSLKIHITNLYGVNNGTALIAQHNVAKIARELGFTEMALQSCQIKDDTYSELKKRLYGITAAVEDDDIIIFQSPTWQNNSLLYDKELLNTIRFHLNVRIAILIHDVMPFMKGGTEDDYKRTIEIYNMADLVIVPSKRMLVFLRARGLSVKKIMIQHMWDLPFDGEIRIPEFQKQIFFSGSPDRFKFISSWDYDIPLRLFHKSFQLDKPNIHYGGWKNTSELLVEYAKGGFGLIWEQTVGSDYYKCNQPYKLASYLAARIPVIIQKGLNHEHMVQEQGWGFTAASLEEAVHIVGNITEEEYYRLIENIKNVSFMVRNGFFTKKLLIDTVNNLLFDREENNWFFLKENTHKPEALICTNSDKIEHCEELIRRIPRMHFHIAAFTAMSPKLMSMEKYHNVSLYPGIGLDGLNTLFEKCDLYFDINYWAEIASAVQRAFLYNQLIFAFKETIHNRKYIADDHVYSVENFERMVSDIEAVLGDDNLMEQYLEKQRKAASASLAL